MEVLDWVRPIWCIPLPTISFSRTLRRKSSMWHLKYLPMNWSIPFVTEITTVWLLSVKNTGILMSCWLTTFSSLSEKKVPRKNSSTHLMHCTVQINRSSSPVTVRQKIWKHWKPDSSPDLNGVSLLIFPPLITRPEWQSFVKKRSWTATILMMKSSVILQQISNPISVSWKAPLTSWLLCPIWKKGKSIFPWQKRY